MGERTASLGTYLMRALRLRCPLCGESRLFKPLGELGELGDWFATLDGCARCGYAYEREPGYFLIAIWGINYGIVALFGIAVYVLLESLAELSTGALIAATMAPMAVLSLLLIRHSKALFLAFDRFVDP